LIFVRSFPKFIEFLIFMTEFIPTIGAVTLGGFYVGERYTWWMSKNCRFASHVSSAMIFVAQTSFPKWIRTRRFLVFAIFKGGCGRFALIYCSVLIYWSNMQLFIILGVRLIFLNQNTQERPNYPPFVDVLFISLELHFAGPPETLRV
jgi:hypothetical protein